LIAAVAEVNTAAAQRRRAEVTQKVEEAAAEIQKEVEKAGGDAGLRSSCLDPLEKLRERIREEESVAHLTQAEQDIVRVSDEAFVKINDFIQKTKSTPGIEEPAVKPRCVVKPAEIAGTGCLETEDEIERFMERLRKKLEEAIASGNRIQIR
jgi:histidinol dehydrogenase